MKFQKMAAIQKKIIAVGLSICLTAGIGSSPMALTNLQAAEVMQVNTITSFADNNKIVKEMHFSSSDKPSLEEVLAQMPETIDVYLNHSTQPISIAVDWECVGEDYESSEGYYFQFSPVLDKTKYRLSETVDLLLDAPYVAIFLDSDVQAMEISPDEIAAVGAESNELTIYNFLIDEIGFNQAAAAGVLANIYHESRFNPKASGDNGTSHGICQWHNSRWDSLVEWCEENNYDSNTLNGQLNYLKYELSKNDSSILYNGKTIFNFMSTVENSKSGAYSAGYYWCYYYEVPADTVNTAKVRGNLAQNTYWVKYGTDEEGTTAPVLVGESIPTTLEAGSTFTVEGIIHSASALTSVTVGVYNNAGKLMTGRTVSPNTEVYDIHDLDNYVSFGILAAGTYHYKIMATNSVGETTLLDETFTVTDETKLASLTLSGTTYTYNGKAKKPKVTVRNSSNKKLKEGTDYTVKYSSGRKNVGTYTVKVTGIGKYTGSIKKTFQIVPKGTTISSISARSKGFKVKWKKQTSQTRGYQIQYATNNKFTSARIKTVVSPSKQTVTINKLNSQKRYYVRIRTYKKVNGKAYYSSWSKVKKVTTKK